MAKDEDLTLDIIARGDNVTQRGLLENDWDHFARQWTQGEWLLFDAPWQENGEEKPDREWFQQEFKFREDIQSVAQE